MGCIERSSFAATQGSFNHNMSPERSIAAESIVHQVPRDTVTLDAADFLLPEPEVGVEPEVPVPLVPAFEELPGTVSCPAISGEKRSGG